MVKDLNLREGVTPKQNRRSFRSYVKEREARRVEKTTAENHIKKEQEYTNNRSETKPERKGVRFQNDEDLHHNSFAALKQRYKEFSCKRTNRSILLFSVLFVCIFIFVYALWKLCTANAEVQQNTNDIPSHINTTFLRPAYKGTTQTTPAYRNKSSPVIYIPLFTKFSKSAVNKTKAVRNDTSTTKKPVTTTTTQPPKVKAQRDRSSQAYSQQAAASVAVQWPNLNYNNYYQYMNMLYGTDQYQDSQGNKRYMIPSNYENQNGASNTLDYNLQQGEGSGGKLNGFDFLLRGRTTPKTETQQSNMWTLNQQPYYDQNQGVITNNNGMTSLYNTYNGRTNQRETSNEPTYMYNGIPYRYPTLNRERLEYLGLNDPSVVHDDIGNGREQTYDNQLRQTYQDYPYHKNYENSELNSEYLNRAMYNDGNDEMRETLRQQVATTRTPEITIQRNNLDYPSTTPESRTDSGASGNAVIEKRTQTPSVKDTKIAVNVVINVRGKNITVPLLLNSTLLGAESGQVKSHVENASNTTITTTPTTPTTPTTQSSTTVTTTTTPTTSSTTVSTTTPTTIATTRKSTTPSYPRMFNSGPLLNDKLSKFRSAALGNMVAHSTPLDAIMRMIKFLPTQNVKRVAPTRNVSGRDRYGEKGGEDPVVIPIPQERLSNSASPLAETRFINGYSESMLPNDLAMGGETVGIPSDLETPGRQQASFSGLGSSRRKSSTSEIKHRKLTDKLNHQSTNLGKIVSEDDDENSAFSSGLDYDKEYVNEDNAHKNKRKVKSKRKRKGKKLRKKKFRNHHVYLQILKKLRKMKQRKEKAVSSKQRKPHKAKKKKNKKTKKKKRKKKKRKKNHSDRLKGKNTKNKAKGKAKKKKKKKKKNKKKKKHKRNDHKKKPQVKHMSKWEKVNFKIQDCKIFKKFSITNIVSLRKMAKGGGQNIYEVLLCTLTEDSKDENGKPVYKCTLMTYKLNGYMFLRRKKVGSSFEFELYVCKDWAGLSYLYSKFSKEENNEKKSRTDHKKKKMHVKKHLAVAKERKKKHAEKRWKKTLSQKGHKIIKLNHFKGSKNKKVTERKKKKKGHKKSKKLSGKKKHKKVKPTKPSSSSSEDDEDNDVDEERRRKDQSRTRAEKEEDKDSDEDEREEQESSEEDNLDNEDRETENRHRKHHLRPSRRFNLLKRLEHKQRRREQGRHSHHESQKQQLTRYRLHKDGEHYKSKKYENRDDSDEDTEEERDNEENVDRDSPEGEKRSKIRHRFRNYLIKKLKSHRSGDDDGTDVEGDVEDTRKSRKGKLGKKRKLIRLLQARKAKKKKKNKLSLRDFEDDLSNLKKRSNDQADTVNDDLTNDETDVKAREQNEGSFEYENSKNGQYGEGSNNIGKFNEWQSDDNLSENTSTDDEKLGRDAYDNTISVDVSSNNEMHKKTKQNYKKRKGRGREKSLEDQGVIDDEDIEDPKEIYRKRGAKRKQPLYGDIGDEEETVGNKPTENKKHRQTLRSHKFARHGHNKEKKKKGAFHRKKVKGEEGFERRSFIPGMSSAEKFYSRDRKTSSRMGRRNKASMIDTNEEAEDENNSNNMEAEENSGIGSGIDVTNYRESNMGQVANNENEDYTSNDPDSTNNYENKGPIIYISSGDDEGYGEDIDFVDYKDAIAKRKKVKVIRNKHPTVHKTRQKHESHRNLIKNSRGHRKFLVNKHRGHSHNEMTSDKKLKLLSKALLKGAKVHLKHSRSKKSSIPSRRANTRNKIDISKGKVGKSKHVDAKYKGMLQNLMDMMSNIKDKISGKEKDASSEKKRRKPTKERITNKKEKKLKGGSKSHSKTKSKSNAHEDKGQSSEESVQKIVEAMLPVVMKKIHPNSTHRPPTVSAKESKKSIKFPTTIRSKPSASKARPSYSKSRPTTTPTRQHTVPRHHSIHHKTTKRPTHLSSTNVDRKHTPKHHHSTTVKTTKRFLPTPRPHPKTTTKPSHRHTTRKRHTTIQLDMIMKGLRALGIKNLHKPSPSPKPIKHKTSAKILAKRTPTKVNKLPSLKTPSKPMPTKPPIPVPVHSRTPNQFNVLCFGDSLTAGYYHHGKGFFPYGDRLNTILNQNLRAHTTVQTKGNVGEMTHKQMTTRLPLVLGNMTKPVDWVIILGGTNDILHVKNFADDQEFLNQLETIWQPRIAKDIEKLHQISYGYGAHTMLLTIPENAIEVWPEYKVLMRMRKQINNALRRFANTSKGKTVLCDLAKQFQRHSLSPSLETLYWDDHLHMTPAGYNRMANIVFKCLKPYIPPGMFV